MQGSQNPLDLWHVGKKTQRRFHIQIKNLGNVQALPLDLQGFFVKATALAHIAQHPHIRQKVHLN